MDQKSVMDRYSISKSTGLKEEDRGNKQAIFPASIDSQFDIHLTGVPPKVQTTETLTPRVC